MPELPEVECVRLSILPKLVGRRVEAARLRKREVVTGRRTPAALLKGERIADIARQGKQLGLLSEGGPAVGVHLGMTGSLTLVDTCSGEAAGGPTFEPGAADVVASGRTGATPPLPHTHVIWQIEGGLELRFRDPRRFGGLWTYPTREAFAADRFARLGPDALTITPSELAAGLARTRRAVKAALLDQQLVAGLGNIYVDEVLFAARLHPQTIAADLPADAPAKLVRQIRRILGRAIESGGSTLRDYVNGRGEQGSYQRLHKVYARAGMPCPRCKTQLVGLSVAQRGTTCCPRCQVR